MFAGARVVDPVSGLDEICDVLVAEGVVIALGRGLEAHGAEVIDLEGALLGPGLVDLHTHLR
ncbi:MAG: dihydroorotase, partial [Actinomycetota bacterium]|nr:dihydroorotase [Actinomycetota bacterium]